MVEECVKNEVLEGWISTSRILTTETFFVTQFLLKKRTGILHTIPIP